ncbi:Fatty acid desaturase [Ceratobasidium sp. AG-Ba]|nr:Fatty acid desaturase [Ceratobasidium sp. AG-Ba]QRW09034.1 Fatty acid desaturase [Ceratobasidium sp. AG-Ba]
MANPEVKPIVPQPPAAPIWWSNAIFFVSMHIAAALGVYKYPAWQVPRRTLVLCIVSWQLASFGITIGYHRLWSHKSFTARRPLRMILAIMGALGFQGSIKWWCLRHRLHHRFTDDPVHDPYAATRGLLYAHVGWIFRKPKYERMSRIEKDDLEADPVVQFQHKFYIPIAIFFGLVVPSLIAGLWSDAMGGFIYGGILARILIWHCTFMINSLAHWEGLQPYSDEVTARGNLILALFTSGEGNHNYHAFPHDFRNGPCPQDWDPSKWIIWVLHKFTPLVTRVRQARDEDVTRARKWMAYIHAQGKDHLPYGWEDLDEDALDTIDEIPVPRAQSFEEWDRARLNTYVQNERRLIVLIDSWVVDITNYIKEHPGGSAILRNHLYSAKSQATENTDKALLKDATWAFNGGMNNHTRTARARMRSLRIARLIEDSE